MITVIKSERRLYYTDGCGNDFDCTVCLGSSPVGTKEREGDGRTPEGSYYVCTVNRQSKYHIALGISYPSPADAKRAYKARRIGMFTMLKISLCSALGLRPPWKTALGGYVMLHGEHPEGRSGDWTAGCIALSDADIERLASVCGKGEKVIIRP